MPLFIDDNKMPEPLYKSITCSNEKIWSENTGRSKSAYMNGTIVSIKKTRSFSFPPLTKAELEKLESKISSDKEWHTVTFKDTDGNIIFSYNCYFGTPTYTVYSAAKNKRYFIDYKVDAIER